ncbi:alpha/beta fold hydrolase [Burkholderia sp. 22PA0106]|uniref:alpha/beta fold hydrolase n=1 Tax=Burkholderia sp. 22PA0106 TaxID=3237371 RepID=UPI0039C4B490
MNRRFRLSVVAGALFALGLAGSASAHRLTRDGDTPPPATAAASAADFATRSAVQDLPLPGGEHQRVLFYGPAGPMRGVIVMFPGGAGDVGIERDGTLRHDNNFVVRTRELWARLGYGVVIVDAIGTKSLRGERSTEAYRQVLREILEYAHTLTDQPLWAMGTSQGSIAAMAAGSTARDGELAGIVLTESVSVVGHSGETVFDARPERVRAPALVVANRDDACTVAPPARADEIARSMSHTTATVLRVEGGVAQSSNPCSSLSPHGYFGIEKQVVSGIAHWMRSVAPPA